MILGIGIGINRFKFAGGFSGSYNDRVLSDGGVIEGLSYLDNVNSILQQASWLLVPSGYKEGKVYAEFPSNGNGDLSFSRSSDAWRTYLDGSIKRSTWNLITYSEQFDNSAWGKSRTTVSANQVLDPFNNLNADKVAETSDTGTHEIYTTGSSPIVLGGTYTASIYAKAAERSSLFIIVGGSQVVINLQTATTNISAGNPTTTLIALSNGWYRIGITFVATTTQNFDIYLHNGSTTVYTGVSGYGLYLFGAQLVEGYQALPYFPTTNRQNVPRLSYKYAPAPALLLEPQRTNSIRNSTMQGASTSPSTLPTNWTSAGSGLSRSVVEIGIINGVNYIDVRIFGTATNVFYDVFTEVATQISTSQNQVWTNSCYLQFINTTNPPLNTNLAMREFSSVGGFLGVYTGANLSVSSLSIQRFVQTKTIVNATCAFVQPSVFFNLTNGASYDFTIRIAAPQMELGAYATTYIPTTSATATRVADTFSRNNIYTNGLITSSGGTWFVELKNNVAYTRDTGINGLFLSESSTGSQNSLSFRNTGGANSRLVIQKFIGTNNSDLYTLTTSTAKIAMKWDGSTVDVFVNGIKVVSASAFTYTQLQFLAHSVNVDVPKFIQQMALFSTPLSDSQCTALTTINGYPTATEALSSISITPESSTCMNNTINTLVS